MSALSRKIVALSATLALLAMPTGAIAASNAPASTQSASTAWTTLSVMSTGTASAATTAAAQEGMSEGARAGGIPLPVIGVWLATLGVFIWIVTRDKDGDLDFGPFPLSPA